MKQLTSYSNFFIKRNLPVSVIQNKFLSPETYSSLHMKFKQATDSRNVLISSLFSHNLIICRFFFTLLHSERPKLFECKRVKFFPAKAEL